LTPTGHDLEVGVLLCRCSKHTFARRGTIFGLFRIGSGRRGFELPRTPRHSEARCRRWLGFRLGVSAAWLSVGEWNRTCCASRRRLPLAGT